MRRMGKAEEQGRGGKVREDGKAEEQGGEER